jgi:peptide/nickel transport system ATP-binding protein
VTPALEITDLDIAYPLADGRKMKAVSGASLTVMPGEVHALVGESGAGKTSIGNAVLGLLEAPGRISAGEIKVAGRRLDPTAGRGDGLVLGRDIGAVFQDPMTSLNPLFTIETQLGEALRCHRGLDRAAARARSIELLKAVGIPEPERRLSHYPHQLSGGQRQRVVIAAALSCGPKLVVADEPTTALDVSVQAQILALLRGLCAAQGVGILLVTHNMGVVAEIADQVSIMQGGRIVEQGPVRDVLTAPRDPYARRLLAAVPRIDRRLDRFAVTRDTEGPETAARDRWRAKTARAGAAPSSRLVSVEDLVVEYGTGARRFRAVDGVSFAVEAGEVFGLVGESGCGKTTVANTVVRLQKPTAGRVTIGGAHARGAVQMVFQDPYASLNPRLRVGTMLEEPILFYRLAASRAEAREDAATLLEAVGLDRTAAARFPHAFSGGQRQRLSIARALGARPRLLVCDEPTSSLDVSVQAEILNLLKDLRDAAGLTLLVISHDLAVIRQMCDRVAVMKAGRIVECATADRLFAAPRDPYTRELLSLVPSLDSLARRTDLPVRQP